MKAQAEGAMPDRSDLEAAVAVVSQYFRSVPEIRVSLDAKGKRVTITSNHLDGSINGSLGRGETAYITWDRTFRLEIAG